jgi:hypothetical protein
MGMAETSDTFDPRVALDPMPEGGLSECPLWGEAVCKRAGAPVRELVGDSSVRPDVGDGVLARDERRPPQARIAAMSGWTPRMAIIRFRL